MIKDISSVSLAFLYVNILGYVFHSIVSRGLGPEGYGEFIVLYSFMLTIGNVASPLGTASVKTVVENFENRLFYLRALRNFAIICSTILGIFLICFSPFLKNFLKVSEIYYFLIIALAWIGIFITTVEKSFLQATGRFPLYALMNSVELTSRLIFAGIFLLIGLKVGGMLSTTVISVFITAVALFLINGNLKGEKAKLNLKHLLKIALYVCPSGFFIYADDIFIRRVFEPHVAGYFASFSVVGKAFIWLCLTIAGVYFPKFVAFKKSLRLKSFVLQILGIIVLLEIFAQIGVIIVGKPLFLMLFGQKFEPAFQFLPYYLIVILPLVFCLIFISIATAVEKGIWLIYLNLCTYLSGFVIIKFSSVGDYLLYIAFLNCIFLIIYLALFRRILGSIRLEAFASDDYK
ncbi:lipopolysaccharide biosynthesis protein [Thermodesulfovibrio hydrogeniphilus]